MLIKYTTGDMFQSGAECLVNTVNCEGYMGKGVAYQFKLKFPENNKAYILSLIHILGLATGSTPVGMYQQLIEWYKKGDLDFSKITTVNLDEYKGLSPDNDQSYRYFMDQNLLDHINIEKSHTYVPVSYTHLYQSQKGRQQGTRYDGDKS